MAKSFTIVVNDTSPGSSTDLSNKIKQGSDRHKQVLEELVKYFEAMKGGFGPKGTVDIDVSSAAVVQASATVTCASVQAADTVTVAGVVLTAHAVTNTGVNFALGASDAACATNLAAAINRQTTLKEWVIAEANSAVVTIRSLVKGQIGNAITLTTSDGTKLAATGSGRLASGTGGTSNAGPTQYTT